LQAHDPLAYATAEMVKWGMKAWNEGFRRFSVCLSFALLLGTEISEG
jgi:hypothetical protein